MAFRFSLIAAAMSLCVSAQQAGKPRREIDDARAAEEYKP
jgi:hypothetical protein